SLQCAANDPALERREDAGGEHQDRRAEHPREVEADVDEPERGGGGSAGRLGAGEDGGVLADPGEVEGAVERAGQGGRGEEAARRDEGEPHGRLPWTSASQRGPIESA